MSKPDLIGARAKINWANTQITVLSVQIRMFIDQNVQEIRPNPATNITRAKVYRHNVPVPEEIKAATGMIIQAQRDSLDYLIVALARKNGAIKISECAFPICDSAARLTDKGTMRKIRMISASDRDIIFGFKPYKGGNDLLYALHWLSNKSKHRELITAQQAVSGASFSAVKGTGGGHVRKLTVRRVKDSANRDINFVEMEADPQVQFNIASTVAFHEIPEAGTQPVIETLREFSSLTNSIIDTFDK